LDDKYDLNIKIYTSEDGVEGLGYIYVTNPGVIIIDTTLPKYSGREILEYLSTNTTFNDQKRKVIILQSSKKFWDLPAIYTVINKREKNFLSVLETEILNSLNIKIKKKKKIENNFLSNLLIKVSSRTDVAGRYFGLGNNIFKKLFAITNILGFSMISGVLLGLFRVLHGKVGDDNIDQNNRDSRIFRVRYYPTLLTLFLALLIIFAQLFSYLYSAVFILKTTDRFEQAEAAGWYSTSWNYRKKLTIQASQIPGATSLTDFPLLINLTTDSDLSADAQADGDDILFTSTDGTTKLDHEIEKYTSGTGELVAWVQIPSLSATVDTEIYVYYGNSGASNQQNASSTWSSDFATVHHLNETATAGQTSATFADSAGTNDSGAQNQNASIAGKIGGGQDFDGTDDYIEVTRSSDFEPATGITVSAWIYWDTPGNSTGGKVISKSFTSVATPFSSFNISQTGTGSTMKFEVNNNGTYIETSSTTISTGQWVYVTATWESNDNLRFYVNGTQQTTSAGTSAGPIVYYNTPMRIGHNSNGETNNQLDGKVDEARVVTVKRSADWISSEYNNQSTPSSFYSLGSEELKPSATVAAFGSQTSFLFRNTTNVHVGGGFSIVENSTGRNITSITVAEQGTVNAQTNLDNIKLYYEMDSSNPYDCASESYAGSETQYGSTDADGFSATNGTSIFAGSVAITATSTMCVYVVVDILSGASFDETIEVQITNPSTEVVASADTLSPNTAIAISGTSIIKGHANLSTSGSQSSNLYVPSTNNYLGGAFIITGNSTSRNVVDITIRESGTVNGQTGINNIKLLYDLDTSAPYDCASESYAGSETQFGSTDTNGFSEANGESQFVGTASVSTTSSMCIYVVLDITSSAASTETLEIDITLPNSKILLSSGETSPLTAVAISGTTTLQVADVIVSTTGTQTTTTYISTNNVASGAQFSLVAASNRTVTGITVREQGSVNGQTGLDNTKLFYDLDSSNPYDCASESYAGTETQFGSTDTDGFSAANGTSAFTGSVAITTTSTMCVYVLYDVTSTASNAETIEIDISNPSSDVTLSSGTVGPAIAVAMSGTTTIASPGWYSTSWNFRKKATILETQISGTTNHANFAVLISITSDSDLSAAVQADSDDILFTASDGTTKLDHEIEKYTTGTGEVAAWVRIPLMSPLSDTVLYMYYGNSSASAQENETGTWNSSYLGVWHMSEDPTGALNDSTSGGNNGTSQGTMTSGDLIAGKLGNAINFDGTDDAFSMGNVNNITTNDFTISAWLRTTYNGAANAMILAKGATGQDGYKAYLGATNDRMGFRLDGPTAATESAPGSYSALNTGSWVYTSMTFDRDGNLTVYINGTSSTTANISTVNETLTNSVNLFIGRNNNGIVEVFNGDLDEVVLYNGLKSSDWISAEFNNQNSPSTFHTIATQDTKPGYTQVEVSTSGTQTASVTYSSLNFYVGGTFIIKSNLGARSLTGITFTESGTIDAQTDLSNITFEYQFDTSAPYDCASESYAGDEITFGAADPDGFSGANGTSAFTDGGFPVNFSPTSTVCGYILFDTSANVSPGSTIEISINNPSSDVTVTSSTVGPATALDISGTTTVAFSTWYNSSWTKRKKMTIKESGVCGTSGALSDFPVLVHVTDSALISGAQADGDDILFTLGDGTTKISHEIENYTSASGALTAWVEIPTLNAQINTEIYMYYSYASASNQQDVSGTWSNGFAGVWHLEEDVTDESTAGTHTDSTSNANNGTQNNNVELTAKIFRGQDFDNTADYINVADPANGSLDFADSTDYTISGWLNRDTFTGIDTILAKKNANTAANAGYMIQIPAADQIIFYAADGVDQYSMTTTTLVNSTGWSHFAVTWDDDNVNNVLVYLSGSSTAVTRSGTLANVNSQANALTFKMAAESDAGNPHDGKLDEIRIANTVRSSDWICSEYTQQNGVISYLTSAGEQTSANASPTVSNVTLNGGSNITLVENTTTSVSWTATVTDTNGFADLNTATGKLYRSGVGSAQACTTNDNNCYQDVTCPLTSCSGNSCTATCEVNMQFHADPTDSGTYSAEYWRSWIEVNDDSAATGSEFSPISTNEVATLRALNVTSSIAYGSLLAGDNTGATNQTTTVTNTGNSSIDIEVSGSQLCTNYPTCSGSTIPVGNQEYSSNTFTYGAGTDLSVSAAALNLSISKPTASPSNTTGSVKWGLALPSVVAVGAYTGANTITATTDI